MLNCPLTREQAQHTRYNQWSGKPKGDAYQADRCAMEVGTIANYHQCSRAAGFGPEHLYCKQHGKRFERKTS